MAVQTARGAGEFDGQPGLLDLAQRRVGDLQKHISGEQLRVGEDVGQVIDGSAGNAEFLQLLHPMGHRLLDEYLLQEGHDLAAVLGPLHIGRIVRVFLKLRHFHSLAEPLPDPLRADCQVEVLVVLTHERLVGDQVGVGRAQPLGRLPVREEICRLVGEPRNLGVHHRDVDVLPLALALMRPVVDGSHDCERRPHPSSDVGHRDPNFLGIAVGLAGDAHQAADALHYLVVSRSAAVGSVLAEP